MEQWLREHHGQQRPALFIAGDFRSLFPQMSNGAYRALIHRAERRGLLERICQGIYQYSGSPDTSGLVLFHAAALLRARHFNYISLETALSDSGVISQIPMGWVTLISTGRSAVVDCGRFGSIEFVHTERPMASIMDHLTYNAQRDLFQADVELATEDMARFGRKGTADLIQREDGTDEHL
ncbi:type IV toxin-antitoxin system AbiEi family antitoxin [Tamilnaduibacter salinus]|uniref:type IV toxin-antitoxin system AbiEi family antitoxin n=1 Tax=Tamilnaduibacter salinus TaxID=1484056 RepID=UPI0039172138